MTYLGSRAMQAFYDKTIYQSSLTPLIYGLPPIPADTQE